MDKPTYNNACNSCKFLGSRVHEGKVHDLYFCHNPGSMHMTLIDKYGVNDWDYSSGAAFALSSDFPMIQEALRLSLKNKGFRELIDVWVMTRFSSELKKKYLDVVADLYMKGEIK